MVFRLGSASFKLLGLYSIVGTSQLVVRLDLHKNFPLKGSCSVNYLGSFDTHLHNHDSIEPVVRLVLAVRLSVAVESLHL